MPEEIISDQGRNYESRIMEEVTELLDIHKKRTTPYHPQCDGQTERFNQTLLGMLRCFVEENAIDWDEWIPKLCLAYRTAVHKSTGKSPFELVWTTTQVTRGPDRLRGRRSGDRLRRIRGNPQKWHAKGVRICGEIPRYANEENRD